jgi:peptidoglycan/xylan/chitin deacetylase (PgdA/CDA1 family)
MLDAIPVLLYHSVPREPDDAHRLSVPYESFCSHMDAVIASERVALTINQLADGLRGRRPLPARPVAITFDDGYEDNLAALDLLGERGLRATIYVTTGTIASSGMLASNQITALASRVDHVEVGAHSVTHPYLDDLRAAEIDVQMTVSKERLEQLLGRPVHSFAYPYGAYDRRAREAVVAAGFQSAAAVKNALSHARDDPWAIARWTVGASTSAGKLERILDGRGAPSAWSRERLRTRSYRATRRLRRRLTGSTLGVTPAGRRERRG